MIATKSLKSQSVHLYITACNFLLSQSSTSILTRKVEAFDHDEQPISNSEKKRFVETTAVVPRLLDVDVSSIALSH